MFMQIDLETTLQSWKSLSDGQQINRDDFDIFSQSSCKRITFRCLEDKRETVVFGRNVSKQWRSVIKPKKKGEEERINAVKREREFSHDSSITRYYYLCKARNNCSTAWSEVLKRWLWIFMKRKWIIKVLHNAIKIQFRLTTIRLVNFVCWKTCEVYLWSTCDMRHKLSLQMLTVETSENNSSSNLLLVLWVQGF